MSEKGILALLLSVLLAASLFFTIAFLPTGFVTHASTPILGDINGDGTVDIYDAILLVNAYNTRQGNSNWNPNADINDDNIVDIYDAIILANHYNQSMTYNNLYQWLDYFHNSVNWTENMDTKYMGYIIGNTTLTDLENGVVALANKTATSWQEVLTWEARLHKYGIDNQTLIQWALDNATMLADGSLPSHLGGNSSSDYFFVGDRELLWGYYWAIQYNYRLDKWNLTLAYTNFRAAWIHQRTASGYDGFLYYFTATNTMSNQRYYDEEAETMACFIQFHVFNATSSSNTPLADAQAVWQWVNDNLWNGTYYRYRYDGAAEYDFECEAGGFLEIINWLKYYNNSLPNTDRLITDFQTRFLSNMWKSPQWTTVPSEANYVVIHAYNPVGTSNPQRRLQNTIMAWTSIMGVFHLFTSEAKQNVTKLLGGFEGYAPAWKLLFNDTCDLYNSTSNLFRATNDITTAFNNLYTSYASALMFTMGIVPINATLAVPIEEMHYEYLYNMLDHSNINLNGKTLTLGIAVPGTMKFIFNANGVYRNFSQIGMYDVTFSSDWSTITSVNRTGDLPDRIYLH